MTPETAAAFLEITARNSGLTFTPEALQAATEQLAVSVERDAAGQLAFTPEGYANAFRVEKGEPVEIPVGQHVAGIILRNTKPAAAPVASMPSAPEHTPLPTRPKPGAPVSDFGKAFAAQHDAAMIRATEKMPNPWLPGQTNRTNQTIITNKNPALAARYKAEARV